MYPDRTYGPLHLVDWCSTRVDESHQAYRLIIDIIDRDPEAVPDRDRLTVLSSRGGATLDYDASGEILAPIAPSTFDVVLTSKRGDWRDALGALVGLPDGFVRCRIFEASNPDFFDDPDEEANVFEFWAGYLDQERSWLTLGDIGSEEGVRLTFTEGWGFKEGGATDGLVTAITGPTPLEGGGVLGSVFRFFRNALGRFAFPNTAAGFERTWDLVQTCMAWRPFVPDDGLVPFNRNPLFTILTDLRLLREDDSIDLVKALRLYLSRFGMRLYQSRRRLYIDQPSDLGRSASLVDETDLRGGVVREWNSDLSFAVTSGDGFVSDRRVDTRGWRVPARAQRAHTKPTNVVESVTDVEPDVENWIANGGFESGTGPDPDGVGIADFWQSLPGPTFGPARRRTYESLGIQAGGFDQRWVGMLYEASDDIDESPAINPGILPSIESPIYIEGGEDVTMSLTYNHFQRFVRQDGGSSPQLGDDMYGRANVGCFDEVTNSIDWVRMSWLVVALEVAIADEMDVLVNGLAGPLGPTSVYAPGVLAIPAGATLYFYECPPDGIPTTCANPDFPQRDGQDYICSFKLTEDARWGDEKIRGEIAAMRTTDTDLKPNFTAGFAVWHSDEPPGGNDFDEMYPNIGPPSNRTGNEGTTYNQFMQRIELPMIKPTGEPVNGIIDPTIFAEGDFTFDPDLGFGELGLIFVDNVRLEIFQDGSEVSETFCEANAFALPGGFRQQLPLRDSGGNIVGDGAFSHDTDTSDEITRDESLSALRVKDQVNNDWYSTWRGRETAWVSGVYQAGDVPNDPGGNGIIEAPGIDCLAAEDYVRVHTAPHGPASGSQIEVRQTLMLEAGQEIKPHQAPILWIPSYVTRPYAAGDVDLYLSAPPSAFLPRNEILAAHAMDFEPSAPPGWVGQAGSTFSVLADNQEVVGWGTSEAYAIQGTGGTGLSKGSFRTGDITADGVRYTGTLYIHNLRPDTISVRINGDTTGTEVVTIPGNGTVYVQALGLGNGASNERLQLRTSDAGDILSAIVWRPALRRWDEEPIPTIVANGILGSIYDHARATDQGDFRCRLFEGFDFSMAPGDCVKAGVLTWWKRFTHDLTNDFVTLENQALIPNDELQIDHARGWR